MNETTKHPHPIPRHPDLYTPDEALAYLASVAGSDRTLETLRRVHGLRSIKIGQETAYYKPHLDALVLRLAGADQTKQQALRLAGTR